MQFINLLRLKSNKIQHWYKAVGYNIVNSNVTRQPLSIYILLQKCRELNFSRLLQTCAFLNSKCITMYR
jgi:hypothetical protein